MSCLRPRTHPTGVRKRCPGKDLHRRVADALAEDGEPDLPLVANHYIKAECYGMALPPYLTVFCVLNPTTSNAPVSS